MDRNRFIQCMKSNIELSDKERRRIIRRSVESQPCKEYLIVILTGLSITYIV